MSRRIKYSNEPMEVEIIRDFLPPPEQLAHAATSLSITIALSQWSVEFFKEAARRNNTSHQLLMRRVLEAYADQERSRASAANRRSSR